MIIILLLYGMYLPKLVTLKPENIIFILLLTDIIILRRRKS